MSEPKWKINKRIRNHEYDKEHTKMIRIKLYEKDYKYIDVWKTIPNKVQWLKDRLDEYAKENGLE